MEILPLTTSVEGTSLFKPREYQEESIRLGVDFLNSDKGANEIHVIGTGGGKSHCIGGVCDGVNFPMLVLQPSQEILKQNYEKFVAYGHHAGMFCASVGRKDLSRVTFASIQSIMSRDKSGRYLNASKFLHFRHIIIDECHLLTELKGSKMDSKAVRLMKDKTAQIADFIHMLTEKHGKPPRVLGYTATPFRLYPCTDRYGRNDSMLKFLTRMRPSLFGKLGYHVQIKDLLEKGFLAEPRYFNVVSQLSHGFDRSVLKVNSTGADYDEKALQEYYDTIDFKQDIVKIIQRINKTGRQVLVFMSSVSDAEWVSAQLPDSATVTGMTPKKERAEIERDFKSGKLRSVCNCGVWQVGFDHPPLKAVLLARPLRSLAMYYQMFGRALRPFNGEQAWMIDACKNLSVFGRIEDLRVDFDIKGLPVITGTNGKLLTGVPLKEQEVEMAQEVMY